MGCIYLISFSNSDTNHRYIGKTERGLSHRVSQHKAAARAGEISALYHAIRKYGELNIKVEILAEEDDPEFLTFLEIHYIRELQTKRPHGYNLTDGGDGMCGWEMPLHARLKISASAKKRRLTPETRAKIGAASKGHKYKLGSKHSDETRAKMSASQKRRYARERSSHV